MDEMLWTEKYRPASFEDIILPPRIQSLSKLNRIDNMIFSGGPGIGKTTVAKALCDSLGYHWIMINGSDERNIDTLRGKIRQFASTVSMSVDDKPKVVLIDEADYLNPNSTQPALRAFMEEFHENCRFILTCNYSNKIIEPIHSRCATYDFMYAQDELPLMMARFAKRLEDILRNENIQYSQGTLIELIKEYAPDWRRIINECQRYSVHGIIDSGIFVNLSQESYKLLVKKLKTKNFKEAREWVAENMAGGTPKILHTLYETIYPLLEPQSVPEACLIIAEWEFKSINMINQDLALMACFTELMELKWR